MGDVLVRRADDGASTIEGLADVLMDCVAGGASVGFVSPLDRGRAEVVWRSMLDSAARGERVILVAEDSDGASVLGTVQVVLAAPENQPHRGEVSKMLVRRAARRRGVGELLMRAAEEAAIAAGKSLLVLDTASADAERLYERLGWCRVGVIPDYALWPDGGFVDTTIYYKRVGQRV